MEDNVSAFVGVHQMTKHRVLICDDDANLEAGWVRDVRSVAPKDTYVVEGRTPEPGEKLHTGNPAVEAAVRELLARRSAVRDTGSPERAVQACLFDDVDVLVLDYDLIHIDERKTRHTGEGIGRLARTFSTCGVVVVLNQFRDVQFDLALRGHVWSYADLNLHAELVGTEGLWSNAPWTGFRPWSWQTLSGAVGTQRSRRDVVSSHYDEPIVDVLGFQEDDVRRLSDSAFEFFWPSAQEFTDLRAVTFRRFLEDVSSDRDAAAAGMADRDAAARFVGARVGKWLEREVLGAQDVLVDVPHLIQRYPFLLGGDYKELAAWNATIHDQETMRRQLPEDCWFERPELLSRPAVWRQRFESDEGISGRSYDFDYSDVPEFVFLEDASLFAPAEEAKEFRAGYHNAFDRRFVQRFPRIQYAPQRRFALGD